MFRTRLQKIMPFVNKYVFLKEKDDLDANDLELHVARYKPEGLDELCRKTNFSRKELKIMYRGFKQECPTGYFTEETFKTIYAQFFPHGDCGAYAHYVFNTLDQDHNGTITFEEFVTGLSILARGTFHEKLRWVFSLYDINGDGMISRDEMCDIVTAVYDMMGKLAVPAIDEHTAEDHVERVFRVIIGGRRLRVNADPFITFCNKITQF